MDGWMDGLRLRDKRDATRNDAKPYWARQPPCTDHTHMSAVHAKHYTYSTVSYVVVIQTLTVRELDICLVALRYVTVQWFILVFLILAVRRTIELQDGIKPDEQL